MQITTTPSQLHAFTFGQLTLRALLLEGEPWFIGADACAALELKNPWDAMGRLDKDDLGNAEVIDSLGRTQKMKTVSESGLYQLIFLSRTEGARAFKKWVTSEVLPAIRKTGSYQVPQTLEERSLAVMTELTAEVQRQKEINQALALEVQQAKPKAEVYDRVLTPEHTFGFRQLVSALREHFPVNEKDVKRVLRERGLLYALTLTATAKAIDGGWAVQRAQGNWGGKERFQPRFTTKTLEWLLKELEPLEDAA